MIKVKIDKHEFAVYMCERAEYFRKVVEHAQADCRKNGHPLEWAGELWMDLIVAHFVKETQYPKATIQELLPEAGKFKIKMKGVFVGQIYHNKLGQIVGYLNGKRPMGNGKFELRIQPEYVPNVLEMAA